jgi:hypothetical protein
MSLNASPCLPATAYFAQQDLAGFSPAQQDPPTPNFRNIVSRGQKFVKED